MTLNYLEKYVICTALTITTLTLDIVRRTAEYQVLYSDDRSWARKCVMPSLTFSLDYIRHLIDQGNQTLMSDL